MPEPRAFRRAGCGRSARPLRRAESGSSSSRRSLSYSTGFHEKAGLVKEGTLPSEDAACSGPTNWRRPSAPVLRNGWPTNSTPPVASDGPRRPAPPMPGLPRLRSHPNPALVWLAMGQSLDSPSQAFIQKLLRRPWPARAARRCRAVGTPLGRCSGSWPRDRSTLPRPVYPAPLLSG